MQETKKSASSAGYITDHGNGSYTGVVKALWTGKPEVRISLACSRQQIGIVYRRILEHGIFHYLEGGFQKNWSTSNATFTLCSTEPNIKGYAKTCNFTASNYGLPWYCGKPKSREMTCSDWMFHRKSFIGRYSPESRIVDKLMSDHQYVEFKQKIKVKVIGDNQFIRPRPVLCNANNKSDSWSDISPIGYFYENRWKTLQCVQMFSNTKENYRKCLSGRPIIIYGDSTARQWFIHLYNDLNLTFVKGYELKVGAMHHISFAVNKNSGLTFIYIPHELPFYSSVIQSHTRFRPLSSYLDYVENGSDVIVVLHWYMHFTRFTPQTYRQHIEHAKRSVQTLLKRSNADIYVKSPHAIMEKKEYLSLDYMNIVYTRILKEVFHDITDKVTFLNEWDITLASQNVPIHPSEDIIAHMVHDLMSRACFRLR